MDSKETVRKNIGYVDILISQNFVKKNFPY